MTSEIKNCQNCKKDFQIEPEDFNFYERIKVPPPTWCPNCRAIRRLLWRNERSLYRNTCASSGKPIISMFAPETGLTVYDRDIWWGDSWDPTAYGKEYDFSKPFFQQWKELLERVPLMNLGNTNCPGSEYGNHNADCKNSYLVYACFSNENIFYSNGLVNVKDSWDLYKNTKCEQCYENTICAGLFNTHFSYDSDDSINSFFLTTGMNLQECLGCVNLRHKTHCIFNKQYTKEEYAKERAKYDFGSYKVLEKFKKDYADFVLEHPRRYANIIKSLNVTGDNIMNAKNSHMLFDCYGDVENCKYMTHTTVIKDSYDMYGTGAKAELLYEGIDIGIDVYNLLGCAITHGCINSSYLYMCFGSSNLFGSIGLRNQEYCILNKKYTKEEYNQLLPKIIEHMKTMPYVDARGRSYGYGEFFPVDLSPFAYNETIIPEYYPLDRQTVEKYGFKWKEKMERNYKIEIQAGDLPDHINDVDDSIVGKVIGCLHKENCDEQCTEAFKVLPDELKFYKKINVALPRLCPNCRHFQRLKKRNPLQLWHRSCMCRKSGHNHEGQCPNECETSYSPERPEIIYCEKCYQQEVY